MRDVTIKEMHINRQDLSKKKNRPLERINLICSVGSTSIGYCFIWMCN